MSEVEQRAAEPGKISGHEEELSKTSGKSENVFLALETAPVEDRTQSIQK